MRPIDQLRDVLTRLDPTHLNGDDIRALLGVAHAAMTAAKIAPPPARLGVVQSS